MQYTFTSSANSGISLSTCGFRLWTDFLHNRKTPPYSSVTPALWDRVTGDSNLSNPDIIFFTHHHPDHYSLGMVRRALRLYPDAQVVMPEHPDCALFHPDICVPLTGSTCRMKCGDLDLLFLRTVHEGKLFSDVPHYSLLITHKQHTIFLSGDSSLSSDPLLQFLAEQHIDIAVLPFVWLTSGRGQTALTEIIRPSHLLINHLPDAADDRFGYRKAAEKRLPLLSGKMDLRLILNPLQRESITL